MIIKVQTNTCQDRFLAEAAYIKWDHAILEIYITSKQTKRVGDASHAFTCIEKEPSLRLRVNDGDIVYIMNDEGKTIDSKHIVIDKEKETCEQSSLMPYLCPKYNPKPEEEKQ